MRTRKKTYTFLACFFLFSAGIAVLIFQNKDFIPHSARDGKKAKFFVKSPIKEYCYGSPVIEIQVEENSFMVGIDLGFQGSIELLPGDIEKLHDKDFLDTRTTYGFIGNEYLKKTYAIPKVTIGDISFREVVLEERSIKKAKDSIVVEGKNTKFIGNIGWRLFYQSNLLLDCSSNTVGFFDSLETLEENGYSLDSFTKAPLILEKDFLEFDVKVDHKTVRCLLDSGSTWNIINKGSKGEDSSRVWSQEELNHFQISSFQVSETEFGPQSFCEIPIHIPAQIPIQIEAILGMDFIKNHTIIIDFKNNFVYLSPATEKM